ncbi:MAG: thioredoxin domain-containing protein, partial [Opitutales bacterium]|nr:thioredoxin domain-containing protein [Opitutales bacterium]
MQNRLSKENSLYLLQHASNPVDWYAWGDEAFEAAKSQNKPLLVSIGYSACHWCHVMAHECFENDYIAKLMNKHFICVKVDREERPDVDQVYMEAVQMIQQQGGWPLNVFCLPDGRPFFGGTYFPPEDRGQGLIPWPQVLMRISEHFKRSKSELVD